MDGLEFKQTPFSASGSPTQPVTSNGKKRKRTSVGAGDESSSENENNLLPKARRACNECRQQKLKCDVRTDPFTRCSRCNKLGLECRIDANFKRVGKRSRHAEMEREIVDLRQQVAQLQSLAGAASGGVGAFAMQLQGTPSQPETPGPSVVDPSMALHHGAADSLLNLSRGAKSAARQARLPKPPTIPRELTGKSEAVQLTAATIDELFLEYHTYFHPFLPILDVQKTPNQVFELSSLLFWVIITVGARRYAADETLLSRLDPLVAELIYDTIFANPQNYHVVKALSIICTWPLPKKKTSDDPTYLLSGLMMEIALQTGLHRPTQTQDFYTRQRIELRDDDIRDRLQTWICCNIVAQEISTAFGQPPRTLYDSSLASLPRPRLDDARGTNPELYWRLQIERFCNRVSLNFYNNKASPIGIASAEERGVWMSVLMDEYQKLKDEIDLQGSQITRLYLLAASLHLHTSALFDSRSAPNYVKDLLNLWFATTNFLRALFDLNINNVSALKYATHHIMMIMLGAGTALMKLLNSFFAAHVDAESGRSLFSNTIQNVRAMSVRKDDLPARLAEALAQLWRYYREGDGRQEASDSSEDNLKLKIQARGSMSVLFDSVWQWREQFSFPFGGSTSRLDSASNNPTIPEVAVDADAMSITGATNLDMNNAFSEQNLMSPGQLDYQFDPNFGLFDPVSTMLDSQFLNFQAYGDNPTSMNFADQPGFYG